MRELLRELYDRLGEVPRGHEYHEYPDPLDMVGRLRDQVGEVLAHGLFDGRMTELDMSQLPPALR